MTTVYKVDHNRVFTGETVELGPKDPIFPTSILTPPPTGEGFHIWDGAKWFTRNEYPTPPQRVPPEPQPRSLTKLQFLDLCQDAGGMSDAQLVAARDDADLASLWVKLEFATSVDRDNPATSEGLSAMAAKGYLPGGAQAVLDAWPMAPATN